MDLPRTPERNAIAADSDQLSAAARALIDRLAARYFWWPAAGHVPHRPRRIIAQVMELGTHEDAQTLRQGLGDAALAETLRAAEPGCFSAKSWHYWHYALGLAQLGQVPPLPRRRLP